MEKSNLFNKAELQRAKELINSTPIPSPPKLLIDLQSELGKPNPDKAKIVTWLSEDLALISKILQTINSPAFGLKVQVKSLEHAINLLGTGKLKEYIIKPAYTNALKNAMPEQSAMLSYSHHIGEMAAILAKEIEISDNISGGEFYFCGLFHEIGSLILELNYPDYGAFHHNRLLKPLTITTEEKKLYGTTHPAIGFLLAKNWRMPDTVCQAIYYHHTLAASYGEHTPAAVVTLSSILKLAIHFVHQNVMNLDVFSSKECSACFESVGNELMLDESTIEYLQYESKNLAYSGF